jgi:hypothetical protein
MKGKHNPPNFLGNCEVPTAESRALAFQAIEFGFTEEAQVGDFCPPGAEDKESLPWCIVPGTAWSETSGGVRFKNLGTYSQLSDPAWFA